MDHAVCGARGDSIVGDISTDHIWQTIGIEVLEAEAATGRMTCEQVGPIIAVLRPDRF